MIESVYFYFTIFVVSKRSFSCLDPCCMSDDGGSPRPPESQMDMEIGNSCIQGPVAPVSPVPSTTSSSKSLTFPFNILHICPYYFLCSVICGENTHFMSKGVLKQFFANSSAPIVTAKIFDA